MRKAIQKAVLIALLVILSACVCVLNASAEDKCGDALSWTLSADGALSIAGEGEMYSFSSWGAPPWESQKENIKEVYIGDGVTSIGNYAFYQYSNISALHLPETLITIGDYAFYGCSIQSLSLSNNVTTLGHACFASCKKLSSLSLSTALKELANYCFSGCSSLIEVTIPNGVERIIPGAFQSCTSLKEVTIPITMTDILGSSFANCVSLETVHYGGKKENADNINFGNTNTCLTEALWICTDGEFSGVGKRSGTCGANVSWVLDETNTLTISGQGNMDDYSSWNGPPWEAVNTSIASVIVTDGVTSIGSYSFYQYGSIQSLTLAPTIISIGQYAFSGTSITSLVLPDSISSLGMSCFASCSSLSSIELSANLEEIPNYAFSSTNITSIVIHEKVESIIPGAFRSCGKLESVFLPHSIKNIYGDSFNYCTSLTDVYFNGDKEEAYSISIASQNDSLINAVWHCTDGDLNGLIKTSGKVTETITWQISDDGILTISGQGEMPNFGSWNPAPWESAKSSIKSVILGENILNLGAYSFYQYKSVENIILPSTILSIGEYAFYGTSITDLSIPNSVTSLGMACFADCSSLSSVKLSVNLTEIPNYAFSSTSITSITIPEKVVSIIPGAFRSCRKLETVFLPNSIKNIYGDSFNHCSSLADVFYQGTKEQAELINYGTENQPLFDAVWHYYTDILVLPTSLKVIEAEAFSGVSVEGIIIPDSCSIIGSKAFENCKKLIFISVPAHVEIPIDAFDGCLNDVRVERRYEK